ncbi:MAG: DEAD/DEAH box helicase [Verrucomicrobiota bacterium]
MNAPPFSELGLPQPILTAIEDLGFERPSDIQAAAIPPALEGRDLVGLSETGSGKTAAFAAPALTNLDVNLKQPQVLILCPTRELANQVCEEVHRLGKHLGGLRALPVYGGAGMDRQLRGLRNGAQLIVGTPGRVLDHLRRGTLNPEGIKFVVLDEADRMLDMGFREEMEELLEQIPEERQTLFFSATMNKGVERLIRRFGREPETIEIKRKTLTVDAIEQVCYEVRERSKLELLSRLLDMDQPKLAIVFCNTKRQVDECTDALLGRGYSADRLHGDISQNLRERVMRLFRERTIEVLVATDVAARGLDVNDVDVVFNFDLPQDPEDYVHRIGRTGRAGRSGRAVTFLFGRRDQFRIQTIERYTRQQIPRAKIPSTEEVDGRMANRMFDAVRERLEAGSFKRCDDLVDQLLGEGYSATDISSVLFTILHEQTGRESQEIIEDKHPEPRPPRERKPREKRERDDRDRRPRGGRKDDSVDTEEGMTRLFLNLGKVSNLKPGDIAGMFYNEAQLPKGSIGRIALFPKHSLIEVRSDVAADVIKRCKGGKLRGKGFKLDYDRRVGRSKED